MLRKGTFGYIRLGKVISGYVWLRYIRSLYVMLGQVILGYVNLC